MELGAGTALEAQLHHLTRGAVLRVREELAPLAVDGFHVAGGAAWTGLQAIGNYLVHHYLHSDSVYGIFGIVLGLVAWLYIAVQLTVYAAEVNVVLARQLWPR